MKVLGEEIKDIWIIFKYLTMMMTYLMGFILLGFSFFTESLEFFKWGVLLMIWGGVQQLCLGLANKLPFDEEEK